MHCIVRRARHSRNSSRAASAIDSSEAADKKELAEQNLGEFRLYGNFEIYLVLEATSCMVAELWCGAIYDRHPQIAEQAILVYWRGEGLEAVEV